MKTLWRAARKQTHVGEPLPWNFPQLQAQGIIPMRKTVTMIAATPNSGKTFMAAKFAQEIKEPTLFFSADTDSDTMLVRCASMATGVRQSEVRAALQDEGGGRDYYSQELADKFGHVRWVWESDPTYEDLALELMAHAEACGQFASVVIVDNLMNIVGQKEDEWASIRDHTKALHRLARVTGSAIFVLHHMSESNSRPDYPAPRRDIQGKVAQLPELIMSLAASWDGACMRVAAVKNRWGPKDVSGSNFTEIQVDLDTGSFYGSEWHRQNDWRL